jgi:acyl-CoA thioesterase
VSSLVGNPFLDGTVVHRVADGHYTASIDAMWNLRPLPHGGMVTALALRAMAAELDDPSQQLRTLHTTFAAQVADGPVEVHAEVLRRGRSMSHLRAEVRNPGAARGHLTTAVFGGARAGFDFTDLEPPVDVPPPAACRSFREPPPEWFGVRPPMPFWDRVVEGRNVRGHPPWEDYEPDRAERVMWYRFDQPPIRPDGTMDPAALVVLADTMPGAVDERIADPGRGWFAPSVDLTVHLLDDCRSDWVLGHNRARWAGGGYASADMALWDTGTDGASVPNLVAYATQLFFFRFSD